MPDNKAQIRTYLDENFLFGAEGVTDDTSLIDEGHIDSTGVLEIVDFLSEEFGIEVDDEEIMPENFGSIGGLAAFLEGKLAKK